ADLTALDAVACRLIGIDPVDNPIIAAAARRKFGVISPEAITILGAAPAELTINDFKLIKETTGILRLLPLPGPAIEWIRQHWKALPEIDPDKCIRCLNCRNGCPLKPPAIDPDKGVKVNRNTCIKCYCCHEFCPVKAIKLKPTWFERHIDLELLSRLAGRVISLTNRLKHHKR
ncbi:MAG: 4Fe-4S dicluster domain-containing protein, partial [Victivallales bacterium]|nr:4Fe-4S dicluster domain-containing protein [Victivallales bacterium]